MTDMTLSEQERVLISRWSELDGDLAGRDPEFAAAVLAARLEMGRGDRLRAAFWQDPEGLDVVENIDYAGDGLRGHMLDVYMPHEAAVRLGKTTPVYIDIHGGGFVYGYKELNRNFCTHLAAQGFAVISISYRPAPQTDFLGQLDDCAKAFAWIAAHLHDYPVDQNGVFLTGDSAGGTLALYMTAIEQSEAFAGRIGVPRAGLNVRGTTLVSPLCDLTAYLGVDRDAWKRNGEPTSVVDLIAPDFFGPFTRRCGEIADLNTLVGLAELPPMLLFTSSDDFLQAEALKLAAAMASHRCDFILNDRHTDPGVTLGHVYPVCMSWIPESREVLEQIRDFSWRLL